MLKNFLTTFSVSAAAAIILTPIVRKIALELGVVDKPGARKVHRADMPTLGGIAIAIGFFAGAGVIFMVMPAAMEKFLLKFTGFSVAAILIILLGIIDDIKPLKAKLKLFIQIIAALILMGCGFVVEKITTPFLGDIPLGYLGVVFSLLWIVGITNAINLLDGLDGLAAGVSGIAAFFISLAAINQRDYVVAFLAFSLNGACAGFLPFNFHPAKIFMGNSGSMFLGFVLSAIAIISFQKSNTIVTLFIPIIALGLPIIDTSLAIVRRIAKKRRIFQADKEHVHHKFLFRQESQRKTVLSLYFLSACFGMIALSFRGIKGVYAVLALAIVGLVIFKVLKDSDLLRFK